MKSAQALLDDLPRNDAHKALMELTEWIESVMGNADFKLDHQFAVLSLLDETGHPHARKLAREYFVPHELNKFQENRLWLVLGNLSRHTAGAYITLFDRYCQGDKGSSAIKAYVPMIVARAIHATAGQLKYICARYGPIDAAIWANLAKLYSHAEQQGYLDTPVALYPGAPETSVRCLVGQTLAWCGSGVNALSPLSMHFTERLFTQYCADIDITVRQDGATVFSFDLNRPVAPIRAKVDATEHPSLRFIGLARLRPKLEALLKTLDKNVVPDSINLGGTYDAELVREAVQYLVNYLNEPPVRRSVRRWIRVSLNVANGFAKVLERTDVGLNFNAEEPQRWEVEDISTGGFRTVLPAQGADGIRIGSLLGVQPEGVPSWGVAVVRRLSRDESNRLHVGAEMLTSQIDGVALSQSGGGGGGFEDGQPALWLQPKQGDSSAETRLLMKADTFSNNRSLQTSLNGKGYLLIPAGLLEKGQDYDLARFRVIEQEVGGSE
ncbi:MAG: hypothetical protein IPM27_04915 [Nitrosomonadales bacterium]|nr:hypothetical protein [Nitrosomonadales bacterium]